jgi:hypothetical protein
MHPCIGISRGRGGLHKGAFVDSRTTKIYTFLLSLSAFGHQYEEQMTTHR